jgi:hypothetical protein
VSLATIAAIGTVVLLVSLPSLRVFAQRQNETDATHVVRILGRAAESAASGTSAARIFANDAELRRRFRDLEVLEADGLLRCHGYLFDVAGGVARAWPWAHGRTGFACFVWTGGVLYGHPNAEGRWSGSARPPSGPWTDAAGWRALR